MNTYFNIRYEFDKQLVTKSIAQQIRRKADYICVADGVVLNTANLNPEYLTVVMVECFPFVIVAMFRYIFVGYMEFSMNNIVAAKYL